MLLDSLSVRDLQLGSVASDPAHKRGLQFVTVYTRVAPLLGKTALRSHNMCIQTAGLH